MDGVCGSQRLWPCAELKLALLLQIGTITPAVNYELIVVRH